jgi:hypothetical protein
MEARTGPVARQLHGHVDRWQAGTIAALNSNEIAYPDMAWVTEPVDTSRPAYDIRSLYASRSDVFAAMFEACGEAGTASYRNGVAAVVPRMGFMADPCVFRMIRVFCHTGIIEYNEGESVDALLSRYSACNFYDLKDGQRVLHNIIVSQLNPSNVMRAYENVLGKQLLGTGLLEAIEDYLTTYAFVVFRHRTFAQFPVELYGELAKLCSRDDLNITESDLMSCLYNLCERRASESETAIEVMMRPLRTATSLWSTIRVASMTNSQFTEFMWKHPNAIPDGECVKVITFLHSISKRGDGAMEDYFKDDDAGAVDEAAASKSALLRQQQFARTTPRRPFRPISFYPRSLQFIGTSSPQVDTALWDKDHIKVFYAVNCSKREDVNLPPIRYNGYFVHVTVYHADQCVHVRGTIHSDHRFCPTHEHTMKLTTSVVNFKHDRWRKKHAVFRAAAVNDFSIANLLSWSTVDKGKGKEDSGYLFDIGKYPEYVQGSWMLLMSSLESQ